MTSYKLLDAIMMKLARVRTIALEGAFWIQQEHYVLRRIKARTKRTEIDTKLKL